MTRGVPLSFFNEEVSLITRLRIDLTRLEETLAGGWDARREGLGPSETGE